MNNRKKEHKLLYLLLSGINKIVMIKVSEPLGCLTLLLNIVIFILNQKLLLVFYLVVTSTCSSKESSNASCKTSTALTIFFCSTTVDTLISDVLTIFT